MRLIVLLAGRVSDRQESPGNGRGVLSLPLTPDRTVVQAWLRALEPVARDWATDDLEVRVALDRRTAAPPIGDPASGNALRVQIVHDQDEYRGTAGTLRDITADLQPDDLVLVGVASQLPNLDVSRAIADLARKESGEGVLVARAGRGDVAGMFLLRRSRLLDVPEVGFCDLKEQLRLAGPESSSLHVARVPDGGFVPIRTLDEYLAAVRRHNSTEGTHATGGHGAAWSEGWRSTFSIVEAGARVDPTAELQDSVVLDGASIGTGATVVRSVVCRGARIAAGSVVVNSVVTGVKSHERA